ncbi:hypothetical protein K5M36_16560 [Chromobacterium vaccinii]|nr:hypothetical protein [Chromobacterium vaccinii]
MADDWAGLSAQLGKMQQAWYVAARSYWGVFDQNADTATIVAEDGSTRQVPSWKSIANAVNRTNFIYEGPSSQFVAVNVARGFAGGTVRIYPESMMIYSNGGGSASRIDCYGDIQGDIWRNSYGGVESFGLKNWLDERLQFNRQFTRSTLPAPSSAPGGIAYITDGPNGPTHVFSNGQKWRIQTMTDL